MVNKLEPTEAQRKAMVDKLGEHVQWSRDGVEMAVDDMLTAANSIADGAPVGTIARRPDGAWKAERKAGGAGPYWQYSTSAFWRADSPDWNSEDDADSWPVIYGPDEYHEGDKPRLERLMREPSVFNSEADEVEELAKWLSIHIGTWPEDEWELRSKPNYYHDRARELLDFGYRKVSDPTAQQEPCCGVSEVYDCDCPPAIRITPKPRTPRVVDRLGVDERGSRWQDRQLDEWKFDGQAWRYLELTWTSVPGGEWVEAEPSKRHGPYVEVLS